MSVKHAVLSALNEFSRLSLELLTAICEVAEGKPTSSDRPEDIMKRIVQVDKRLQASLEELVQHQKVQQKIIDLQNQIRERDREILQLAALLHGAERQLEKITEGARSKLDAVKQANTNPVDLDTLIEYAYRITYNTGRMPGIREYSPYPPDGAIQASRLMSGISMPPSPTAAAASAADVNAMDVVHDHADMFLLPHDTVESTMPSSFMNGAPATTSSAAPIFGIPDDDDDDNMDTSSMPNESTTPAQAQSAPAPQIMFGIPTSDDES